MPIKIKLQYTAELFVHEHKQKPDSNQKEWLLLEVIYEFQNEVSVTWLSPVA